MPSGILYFLLSSSCIDSHERCDDGFSWSRGRWFCGWPGDGNPKLTMFNRKHIFEWWMFHLSWTKTVAENPCQPTVLVSLAYGGLTLFTQTNFWWFRRIPDSLVTSHIQAWWLWWPQDLLESAAKMKCHGYVHHVFLKNPMVSFSECAQQIWINYIWTKVAWYTTTTKNYKPEWEVVMSSNLK